MMKVYETEMSGATSLVFVFIDKIKKAVFARGHQNIGHSKSQLGITLIKFLYKPAIVSCISGQNPKIKCILWLIMVIE
jgi:hypothetical protein